MFKKIASLFVAAAMITATAAITASAAETDAETVAAEDSAVVSADSSSEVGADSSSEVGAGNTISFDVKKSNWGNVKTVYCHIWKADGTPTSSGEAWPEWQTKKELATYNKDTGIATFDLSKTGHEFSKSDGKIYCVIFSANTGMQTYNTIMSGACIGDTMYCNGEQIENPEDSAKKANVAVWQNNPDCGPERKITSTGNIVGSAFPEGESDVTLLANYLMQYYDDPAKTDPTTGKKTDTDALDKVQAGGTSTNLSGSGSSSGSGSGSGSGSVQSGQETTIFFVFGALMLAAAGVAFLARKKREE